MLRRDRIAGRTNTADLLLCCWPWEGWDHEEQGEGWQVGGERREGLGKGYGSQEEILTLIDWRGDRVLRRNHRQRSW
jgi:hypothetical protein